jgi:hypothetical protein
MLRGYQLAALAAMLGDAPGAISIQPRAAKIQTETLGSLDVMTTLAAEIRCVQALPPRHRSAGWRQKRRRKLARQFTARSRR